MYGYCSTSKVKILAIYGNQLPTRDNEAKHLLKVLVFTSFISGYQKSFKKFLRISVKTRLKESPSKLHWRHFKSIFWWPNQLGQVSNGNTCIITQSLKTIFHYYTDNLSHSSSDKIFKNFYFQAFDNFFLEWYEPHMAKISRVDAGGRRGHLRPRARPKDGVLFSWDCSCRGHFFIQYLISMQ